MKKTCLWFLVSAIALALSPRLKSQPLVNLGPVGVGRLPANSFDALGPNVDTLGGIFSGLYLDPAGVAQSQGTYSGVLFGLPDRGFGDGLTDYHPRVQSFSFAITPYYGPFPAPSQDQIQLANTGTLLFTTGGSFFTGYNPDDTNVTTHPQSPLASLGAGKWSLDAEGLVRTRDGGFYVSDEYGPLVYRFDSSGVLQDVLVSPAALIPKSGSAYPRVNNFGLAIPQVATNDSGRFVNRGLEGLSITPDGRKLVAVLQSPCIQDGENRNPSRNTRILVFDINPASATYHEPIAEYVYQCTLNAVEARNRHTPISEILALSDTRFLVLERDSRGRGGDSGPILYKRVVLADVSQASNILGTGYDFEKGAPGQLSLPRATLPSNIVAAARVDLVDLADAQQLAKFGLNTRTNWDNNTLTEKWEGLAVIPLNDPNAPNDYLLLVGNDNDFKAPLVYHNGQIVGTNDVTLDSMLLAFRIGEDHIPPTVACPGTITLAANSNCVATVDLRSRVTASDNSAAPLTIVQDPPPGAMLGLGTHTVTLAAIDAAGNHSEPCAATVTVVDQTPPNIASLTPSLRQLWSPNHKMVPVTLSVTVTDGCDPNPRCEIVRVTSNAPFEDSSDDHSNRRRGDRSSDWQITGPLTVNLRAERHEDHLTRIYFITVRCTDAAGNSSIQTTSVTVPSNQGRLVPPGFLTHTTPYALPVGSKYTMMPLLSSGDRVPRTGQPGLEYQMVGIPDGLGAHRNPDGTISVYMNHEMGNAVTHEPRFGEALNRGAIVSKFILGPDASVLSGDRAYDRIFVENTFFGPAPDTNNTTPGFSRLCSGALAWQEAGFDRPIYFCGEESGSPGTFDGRGGLLVAIFDNELHTLPKAGRIAWENAAIRPDRDRQTVIMGLEDGPESPDSQLYMYVGSKDRRRGTTALRRNGLDNGQLYVLKADSETETNEVNFQEGSIRGRWVRIPNADSLTDVELETAADTAGAFGFIRIEDGAFRPSDPNEFYFVTTGGAPGNVLGRLYRLDLNEDNVLGPARLTVIYNADQVIAAGGDIAISPDNIAVTDDAFMICEDGTTPSRAVMGALGRQGNIWRIDRRGHSADIVAALAPFGRDGIPIGSGVWETSGIIDVSSLLGPDLWLFNVQAHRPTSAPPRNTVEDGQLLLMIRNR
ncbi:MAG: esterase-like activity of phytase family protein [Verrucomicrobia bacterium]|nr:esterase-like activity of phytase family protein [Verrucomicrobiota bacterium]